MRGWWHRLGEARLAPARYLLAAAAALALLFAVAQLCGLREYTTFLSGNVAALDVSRPLAYGLGTVYLALYLAAVLVAPVLGVAGGLLAATTLILGCVRRHGVLVDRPPGG